MKNKKGSMELGINAIVILIIALALLGIGIAFITKLIGGSQAKFEGFIEQSKLPVNADADNPLMFDPASVDVKAKKTAEVIVVVYNSLTTEAEVSLSVRDGICTDDTGGQTEEISIVSAPKTMKSGMEGGFKALIRAGDIVAGTYICDIVASMSGTSETDEFSQQIYVKVYR
ncbi:hypothetical protein JW756_07135 [Candidatus Woesearchaeota archaeon]|nr:hypothetical protein [Candidatus Woesearchaeota archaeon]